MEDKVDVYPDSGAVVVLTTFFDFEDAFSFFENESVRSSLGLEEKTSSDNARMIFDISEFSHIEIDEYGLRDSAFEKEAVSSPYSISDVSSRLVVFRDLRGDKCAVETRLVFESGKDGLRNLLCNLSGFLSSIHKKYDGPCRADIPAYVVLGRLQKNPEVRNLKVFLHSKEGIKIRCLDLSSHSSANTYQRLRSDSYNLLASNFIMISGLSLENGGKGPVLEQMVRIGEEDHRLGELMAVLSSAQNIYDYDITDPFSFQISRNLFMSSTMLGNTILFLEGDNVQEIFASMYRKHLENTRDRMFIKETQQSYEDCIEAAYRNPDYDFPGLSLSKVKIQRQIMKKIQSKISSYEYSEKHTHKFYYLCAKSSNMAGNVDNTILQSEIVITLLEEDRMEKKRLREKESEKRRGRIDKNLSLMTIFIAVPALFSAANDLNDFLFKLFFFNWGGEAYPIVSIIIPIILALLTLLATIFMVIKCIGALRAMRKADKEDEQEQDCD